MLQYQKTQMNFRAILDFGMRISAGPADDDLRSGKTGFRGAAAQGGGRQRAYARGQPVDGSGNGFFHILAAAFTAGNLINIFGRQDNGFKLVVTVLAEVFINRHFLFPMIK